MEELTPPTVVSIDVGVRNMAFAVCRPEGAVMVLERTGKHAFPNRGSINDLVPAIVAWCESTFPAWDVVLVENQLGTTMKALQCALLAHFHTRAKGNNAVAGVPPHAKLRGCEKGASYARRKAFCVEQVRARLVEGADLQLRDKPDDVCDAVMQAVIWCEARGLLRPSARISCCQASSSTA